MYTWGLEEGAGSILSLIVGLYMHYTMYGFVHVVKTPREKSGSVIWKNIPHCVLIPVHSNSWNVGVYKWMAYGFILEVNVSVDTQDYLDTNILY